MKISRFAQERSATGARACLDQMIRCVADREAPRWMGWEYFRLVNVLREHTDLLHHRRLRERESPMSVRNVLIAAAKLSKQHFRFVRPPETFDVQQNPGERDGDPCRWPSLNLQWHQLVSHLVEPYPEPMFLSRCWLDQDAADWTHALHFSFAEGASFRGFVFADGSCANRVVARFFMQAPDHVSVEEAIRFGQLMSLAFQANRPLDRIYASKVAALLPLSRSADHEVFSKGLLRFVERERPAIEECAVILAVAYRTRFETARVHFGFQYPEAVIDPAIDLSDWTHRRVRRWLNDWETYYRDRFRDQVIPSASLGESWKRSGLAGWRGGSQDHRYAIVELLTPKELRLRRQPVVALYCVLSIRLSSRPVLDLVVEKSSWRASQADGYDQSASSESTHCRDARAGEPIAHR